MPEGGTTYADEVEAGDIVPEVRGMVEVPADHDVGGGEATLFVVGVYELKAAAEELPPVQVRRRAGHGRGQVDQQLLLWPDAEEPVDVPVSTVPERR